MNKLRDFSYSLASFSGGLSGYVLGAWYVFFYVDELGLNTKYYGIAMIIYGLWNAINDPLMGYLSDRTKSRFGRRKPYVLFGAIPLSLSLVLVFSPPMFALGSQTSLFIYFITSLCVFDTFFSMVMLNWVSVLPEMYLDEKNRVRVGATNNVLGILGAMIATLAAQPLINVVGFSNMGIFFATIAGITMLIAANAIPVTNSSSNLQPLSFFQSLKETLSNFNFRILVSSVLLIEVAKIISTSTMAFYAKYALKNDGAFTIIMGIMFVFSMISSPFVAKACNKFGAKKTYIISSLIFACGSLGFLIAPSTIMAAIVGAIVGMGVGGILIMPNMLYAQTIDEDHVKTGQRREGSYYGINALIMRLSIAIQGITTMIIFSSSGYVSGADSQVSSAIVGVRILMGLVPLIFTVVAIVILRFYRIDDELLKETKRKVLIMNGEKDLKEI